MGSPKGKGKGKGKGGGAPAEAPKEMAAGGNSVSWIGARQNNISVGDDFLEHIASCDEDLSARWGKKWVDVAENEAASQEIFARLATYLAEVHVIRKGRKNAGKHFDSSTAEACWGDLLRGNEQRFSKSKEEATCVSRPPCLPLPALRLLRARPADPRPVPSRAYL